MRFTKTVDFTPRFHGDYKMYKHFSDTVQQRPIYFYISNMFTVIFDRICSRKMP